MGISKFTNLLQKTQQHKQSILLFETFVKNSKWLQQIEASLSFLQREETKQKMD